MDFEYKISCDQLGKDYHSKVYIIQENNTGKELKCVNPDEAPFIYRTLLGDDITENDMVFSHDNKLARFLEIPSMSISYEQIR